MLNPNERSYPAPKKRLRRALMLAAPLIAAALAIGAGVVALPAAPATAAPAAQTRMLEAHGHPAQKFVLRVVSHVVTPPAAPEPVAAPAAEPAATQPDWSISITAVGLQAEVDQCQWVLMDFSSAVPLPIVAAHNFCGGGIVLEMVAGQTVSLRGVGLDGNYVVIGSKDAWADQDATDALAGLGGDVVLQTCYWDNDGHLMLVALQRVS